MDGTFITSSIKTIAGSLAEGYEAVSAQSAASIDLAPGSQERLAPEAMIASGITPSISSTAVAGIGIGTILIVGAVAWLIWS